jgi:hypothetical protein
MEEKAVLLFTHSDREMTRRRRIRASARFRPAVDGLESRVVLSPATVAMAADVSAAQRVTNPLAITGINVTNLQVIGANQLRATADITGTLLGQAFTLRNQQVPITLNQTGTTTDGCPILNLAVGPLDLNLLGLRVQLNNCATPAGPVTVNITAIPSTAATGGLLGDLLCGLTRALPGNLLGNLTSLMTAQQGTLTQAITGLLNGTAGQTGLLSRLLTGATNVTSTTSHGARTCNILDLRLQNGNTGLALNLLGLDVTTSPICLSVFAQRGGLLGNLLCNLTGALNRGVNPARLTRQAGQIVQRINRGR